MHAHVRVHACIVYVIIVLVIAIAMGITKWFISLLELAFDCHSSCCISAAGGRIDVKCTKL